MTRKDFIFICIMIAWTLSAIVLIPVFILCHIPVKYLDPMTFVFLGVLMTFAGLMQWNRKFNHWVFKDSKVWAYLSSRRFDDDVKTFSVDHLMK